VVIFGGYGTFGALVAAELARRGISLLIAGRDGGKAEAFARRLGPAHRGCAADLLEPDACRAPLRGQTVAVNCAGPFSAQGPALLELCLEAGCHYVDIADDRGYVARVRRHSKEFARRGLAAVYGCSSLPAISGALALRARAGVAEVPERARVTLFIGNRNPKGRAAVASLVQGLGRPIPAPQGVVKGFRDREVVPLPAPFGRRTVFNFESPEYDLFPGLLGVSAVSVKVGFELWPVTYALAFLAMLGANHGASTVALLSGLGRCLPAWGSSGGVVMAELFSASGAVRRAALLAREGGQRMAALPCVQVALALLGTGPPAACGAMTAYEVLGAQALLEHLVHAGFELYCTGA
jgi:hypothetical protein